MQQLLFLLAAAVCASVVDATYEQLFPGYTNVYEENIDADVIIERGQVPEWLEGKSHTRTAADWWSFLLADLCKTVTIAMCNTNETKVVLSNYQFDKLIPYKESW